MKTFVAVITVVLILSACSTVTELPESPLPAASTSGNVLVYRGIRFSFPDTWRFYAPPRGVDLRTGFVFTDNATSLAGTAEFIRFDTAATGLSLTRFLDELREAARGRADRVLVERYVGSTLVVHVLKEYRKDPDMLALVRITAIVPVSLRPDYDVIVMQVEPPSGSESISDPDGTTALLLSGLRFAGERYEGRYFPTGLAFYRSGSSWTWLSDVPGGFAVMSVLPDGEIAIVTIQRTDSLVPEQTSEESFGPIATAIGSRIVPVVYRREDRARGTVLRGSFVSGDETWRIVIARYREGSAVTSGPGPDRPALDAAVVELFGRLIDLGPVPEDLP